MVIDYIMVNIVWLIIEYLKIRLIIEYLKIRLVLR
jgi:hypothetical protein